MDSSFDNTILDEFDAIEAEINAGIESLSVISNSSVRASALKIFNECSNGSDHTESPNELDSDSVEIVNPRNTKPLPSEDPIQSYDTVVKQMTQSGVQWIPPDQTDGKLSEVRLAAPDHAAVIASGTSFDSPTTPTRSNVPATGLAPSSKLMSTESPLECPSNDESLARLRELQFQLNQEKATRKQQEDYIQQLQRYYDNLLAKHAAAEMTIDHLRLRSKIGGPHDDNKNGGTSRARPTAATSTTLRGRKLISASLDTCAPHQALSRNQARISESLATLKASGLGPRAPTTPSPSAPTAKSLVQSPQAFPAPMSSSSNHLERSRLTEKLDSFSNGNIMKLSGVVEDEQDFNSNSNGDFNCLGVESTAQEAAKTLESQLNASLTAIHDRLNGIEARLSEGDTNEALNAIHEDLEELRRRYQAGQYLWSDGGFFDSKALVGLLIDRLTQRVHHAACRTASASTIRSGLAVGTGDSEQGLRRPSSLSLTAQEQHRQRRKSAAISTAGTMTSASSSNDTTDSGNRQTRQRMHKGVGVEDGAFSSSSATNSPLSASFYAGIGTNGSNTKEAAEAHFARLLSRYNKLKVMPGHGKDVESLMQRMLQLSDRYSTQSTVIYPPKSLRRMFESDYSINSGANEALMEKEPSAQMFRQPLVANGSKTSSSVVGSAAAKSRHVVSPDSGVARTPVASSSGSSGASCCYDNRRLHSADDLGSGVLTRQTSAPTGAVVEECEQRKQSDSGFWLAESCSVAANNNTLVSGAVGTVYGPADLPGADRHAPPPEDLPHQHPGELLSLEADIQRLRQGIARLTSASSANASPSSNHQHRNRRHHGLVGVLSDSSASTSECSLRQRSRRRTLRGARTSSTADHHRRSSRRSRLPSSSSTSLSEAEVSPYRHHRHPRRASRSSRIYQPLPQPLEVVGVSMHPQPAPLRTYKRQSSRRSGSSTRLPSVVSGGGGHRRSHSSASRGLFYQNHARSGLCGSCGGSGFNLSMVGGHSDASEFGEAGEGEDEIMEVPLHSRTVSDTYTLPSRVIYEYRHSPTMRLPVQQQPGCGNGWTERVYGIHEIYGSAVSPQINRGYNTIGHQPSTRAWSNQSQASWGCPAAAGPVLLPATSSPVIASAGHHRAPLRHYVPAGPATASQSLYDCGTGAPQTPQNDFSSSDLEDHDVLQEPRPRRSGHSRHRHTSSSRHNFTEQGGRYSPPSDGGAFATARAVAEMAHHLNSKLTRHQHAFQQPSFVNQQSSATATPTNLQRRHSELQSHHLRRQNSRSRFH